MSAETRRTNGVPDDPDSDARLEAKRCRWRCNGRAGERGPAERAVAASVEKTLGYAEGEVDRCPFEGVYYPGVTGGHLAELLDARLLVSDEHVSWTDALGRELTAVDVDALGAFKRAKARIDALNAQERERERAAAEQRAKGRGRGRG